MHRPKKTAGRRKQPPCPSEAEMALYRCLVKAKPTREERGLTVRHLLREASRNLEGSR